MMLIKVITTVTEQIKKEKITVNIYCDANQSDFNKIVSYFNEHSARIEDYVKNNAENLTHIFYLSIEGTNYRFQMIKRV